MISITTILKRFILALHLNYALQILIAFYTVGEDEEYKDESDAISKTISIEEYKDSDCNM